MQYNLRWDDHCVTHITMHDNYSSLRRSRACVLRREVIRTPAIREAFVEKRQRPLLTYYADFCCNCNEHESNHVRGRCVTAATKFESPHDGFPAYA